MENKQAHGSSEYEKAYSESSLFEKIARSAKSAGLAIIYAVLVLYFTLVKESTPIWAKGTIVGALGYFIFPVDAIPDFLPVIGYSDDLAVLLLAIAAVGMNIDQESRRKAKAKLHDWFGTFDESELGGVDSHFG